MCRGFHHRDIRRVHNYGYRGVRLGLDRRQNKGLDMHRTQMLLPIWLNSFINLVAKRHKWSKGDVIRRMLICAITGRPWFSGGVWEDLEFEARKQAEEEMEKAE